MNDNKQIIFFDGVCIFCAKTITIIANATKNTDIKFAYLQSELATTLLHDHTINPKQLDTVIFYDNGKVYQKFEAITKLSKYMNWKWKWLRLLSWIPNVISNFFYDIVAKYRYRIFGKKDSCSINPKFNKRLL